MNGSSSFFVGLTVLEYFHHEYNDTRSNERRVEIPLAFDFLSIFDADVVEIGAVTPYYIDTKHTVIDLYDEHEKSLKIDALTYDYQGKNVLAISTIEHFGEIFDDPKRLGEYFDKSLSFKGLKKIIEQAKNYLITFPIGINKELDNSVKNSDLNFSVLKRLDWQNNWSVDKTKSFDYNYGQPFIHANAICIISNLGKYV